MDRITLYAPGSQPPSDAPPASLLAGTWHVTHSTLPMWKKAQNVRITYTALPDTSAGTASASTPPALDDLVEYQPRGSSRWKTVRGIDRPAAPPAAADANQPTAAVAAQQPGAWSWNWRGRGWLMIVSSQWQILGYGIKPPASSSSAAASAEKQEEKQNMWAVTFFERTIFTPAGVDVYSRDPAGLRGETVEAIRAALRRIEGLETLSEGLFEVPRVREEV